MSSTANDVRRRYAPRTHLPTRKPRRCKEIAMVHDLQTPIEPTRKEGD